MGQDMEQEFVEKYVHPFTDFGFKRIFGEEFNKDILIDFLNALLEDYGENIVDLTYLNSEQLGDRYRDRKAVFDLYCQNDRGEKFIVEMQKTKQNFFKDRTVYYSTFPIREQGKTAEWNFELKSVYLIGILDFIFDEDKNNPEKLRYDVKLTDIETKKVFYEKLTFIYLEMPKFKKTEDELETRFDKWLYFLRNLNKLDHVPEKLKVRIFEKAFLSAEIAKFNQAQLLSYEDSLKQYRDLKNSLDTAFIDGKAEGLAEGLAEGIEKGKMAATIEMIKNGAAGGVSVQSLAAMSGLSVEDVQRILETV